MADAYTYVWEFSTPCELANEFERHYGAEGSWAQLFRRAPGYIGTALLADRAVPGRYLTIDRWESEQAYQHFRSAYALEYAALDSACERLTNSETFLGAYRE